MQPGQLELQETMARPVQPGQPGLPGQLGAPEASDLSVPPARLDPLDRLALPVRRVLLELLAPPDRLV